MRLLTGRRAGSGTATKRWGRVDDGLLVYGVEMSDGGEDVQILPLQGQDYVEFRSARHALCGGKSGDRRGQPPEFKGEPGNWSPEELLVGSLNTCIMLTFLTLAQARPDAGQVRKRCRRVARKRRRQASHH